MASFTCKDGHEWTIRELDNTDRDEIKRLCGVDILDEKDSGRLEGCGELMSTEAWLRPLSYLLADQLRERGMSVTEIRLTGKQAAAAREAVLDEFQAFFHGRSTLRSQLFKQMRETGNDEINRRMIALTVGKLETMDLSPLNSGVDSLLDAAIAAGVKTLPTSNAGSTS
jgi:hypothetical protein